MARALLAAEGLLGGCGAGMEAMMARQMRFLENLREEVPLSLGRLIATEIKLLKAAAAHLDVEEDSDSDDSYGDDDDYGYGGRSSEVTLEDAKTGFEAQLRRLAASKNPFLVGVTARHALAVGIAAAVGGVTKDAKLRAYATPAMMAKSSTIQALGSIYKLLEPLPDAVKKELCITKGGWLMAQTLKSALADRAYKIKEPAKETTALIVFMGETFEKEWGVAGVYDDFDKGEDDGLYDVDPEGSCLKVASDYGGKSTLKLVLAKGPSVNLVGSLVYNVVWGEEGPFETLISVERAGKGVIQHLLAATQASLTAMSGKPHKPGKELVEKRCQLIGMYLNRWPAAAKEEWHEPSPPGSGAGAPIRMTALAFAKTVRFGSAELQTIIAEAASRPAARKIEKDGEKSENNGGGKSFWDACLNCFCCSRRARLKLQ